MKIIGIDPGLKGGLAVLDRDGHLLHKEPMPVSEGKADIEALDKFFQTFKPDQTVVYMEDFKSGPVHTVGLKGLGIMRGILQTVLWYNYLNCWIIKPNDWTRVILNGIDKRLKPKERAFVGSQRYFPTSDFRPIGKAGEPLKNPHDGMIDAALIARYGRMVVNGEISLQGQRIV